MSDKDFAAPTPSMKDVALACGVHPSTVSRALRNDPSLPARTRKRIQEKAHKLGYRPHPLVSALIAMRRSRTVPQFRATIAFLRFESVSGHTPARYEAGARRAAERQGFHLESFLLGDGGLRPARLDVILRARNISGVIIGPLPEAHGHFDLDWPNLSTVALEYTYVPAVFDRVVHDSYGAMKMTVEQCWRRGLRRVGLLFSRLAHERTERKVSGAYWSSMESYGIATALPPLIVDEWEPVAIEAWFREHRPEVIVVSNAFHDHVRDWLKQRRIRVPQDVGLVNLNAEARGPTTGVFQNPEVIGITAARMVIDRITHNDRGVPQFPQTVLIPGAWVEGGTLRPAAAQHDLRAL